MCLSFAREHAHGILDSFGIGSQIRKLLGNWRDPGWGLLIINLGKKACYGKIKSGESFASDERVRCQGAI